MRVAATLLLQNQKCITHHVRCLRNAFCTLFAVPVAIFVAPGRSPPRRDATVCDVMCAPVFGLTDSHSSKGNEFGSATAM